jgi:hypothetical protein
MQKPPLDPDVADVAPTAPTLTAYDQQHLVTYLRLLDADAEGEADGILLFGLRVRLRVTDPMPKQERSEPCPRL